MNIKSINFFNMYINFRILLKNNLFNLILFQVGSGTGTNSSSKQDLKEVQSSPFCVDLWQHSHKSLIIWGVEPIGPLSKTGGIYELARIDSPKRNAFENIAWFPCFLPSFTLGNSSSSPSTLFASTDADQITIYQV